MVATRKLSEVHMKHLFGKISSNGIDFTEADFNKEFSNMEYFGKQILSPRKKIQPRTSRSNDIRLNNSVTGTGPDNFKTSRAIGTGLILGNTGASKWETDVIEKLRRLIKNSGKTIDSVFSQFDVDGSGDVTAVEFRKAMKLISLGLTDIEINKIMARVDTNNDGQISYAEFASRFRDDPHFDARMVSRANDKIGSMKEKMILYMTSA